MSQIENITLPQHLHTKLNRQILKTNGEKDEDAKHCCPSGPCKTIGVLNWKLYWERQLYIEEHGTQAFNPKKNISIAPKREHLADIFTDVIDAKIKRKGSIR